MVSKGFLDAEARQDLIKLARDGSVEHRLGRRVNALVLLDKGMSCQKVAEILFIDDDTVRTWFGLYEQDGIEGLAGFKHNRCYAKFCDFCAEMLTFLREDVPRNWKKYCDSVTDNFRVILPETFRVLT